MLGFTVPIQPVNATHWRLCEQVADGTKTADLLLECQKALKCERWRKGESLQRIAQLFDRSHSSVQRILSETGGIQPAQRRRSRLALTQVNHDTTPSNNMAINHIDHCSH
jgi:hypothetical protein